VSIAHFVLNDIYWEKEGVLYLHYVMYNHLPEPNQDKLKLAQPSWAQDIKFYSQLWFKLLAEIEYFWQLYMCHSLNMESLLSLNIFASLCLISTHISCTEVYFAAELVSCTINISFLWYFEYECLIKQLFIWTLFLMMCLFKLVDFLVQILMNPVLNL
jgi:hypothetical protein